ncbi:MAG: betaine/proline/choline family ABC transporter ATP-binding protein [Alicyclobacillus sp.]|nr:betaine/proline/choline family ABC transporter ATP-binding protein [Alicyclobacillus sp.]
MTVAFQHVTKVYQGGRPAIEDLTLEIRTGELMVFIGPSGCGKTTTLRMVNRLEEPTSGTVEIDGRDVRSYQPVELRRGIGYTVQQTGLFPHMTIRENIEVVPRLLGWPKDRREARVRELLNLVNMRYEEFAHRYPRQLSGGQQQRVGVLRSLAADPPIILMDEPFGALDPISREALQVELKRLQSQLHKTIVFVTHDIDEAIRLGDRIAVFQTGRLVQVGTPEDILHRPANEFVASFVKRDFLYTSTKTAKELARADWSVYSTSANGVILTIPGSDQLFAVDRDGAFLGFVRQEALEDGLLNAVSPVQTLPPAAPAKEVFALMKEQPAVPVVDEHGCLVGVVTPASVMDEAARLLGGGNA